MFNINPKTWNALLHHGNTGTKTIRVKPKSEHVQIYSTDVVLFRIADMANNTLLRRIIPIESYIKEDLSEGFRFNISFTHEQSKELPVGNYVWDVTVYRSPTIIDGVLVDGDIVDTPIRKRPFTITAIVSEEVI
jgi:hypothetical protein